MSFEKINGTEWNCEMCGIKISKGYSMELWICLKCLEALREYVKKVKK